MFFHVADFVFINYVSVGRSVFTNPICIIFITYHRMGIPQQVIIFILHLNINTKSQPNIAPIPIAPHKLVYTYVLATFLSTKWNHTGRRRVWFVWNVYEYIYIPKTRLQGTPRTHKSLSVHVFDFYKCILTTLPTPFMSPPISQPVTRHTRDSIP